MHGRDWLNAGSLDGASVLPFAGAGRKDLGFSGAAGWRRAAVDHVEDWRLLEEAALRLSRELPTSTRAAPPHRPSRLWDRDVPGHVRVVDDLLIRLASSIADRARWVVCPRRITAAMWCSRLPSDGALVVEQHTALERGGFLVVCRLEELQSAGGPQETGGPRRIDILWAGRVHQWLFDLPPALGLFEPGPICFRFAKVGSTRPSRIDS